MKRIRFLGSSMDATTMDETVECIKKRVKNRQFTQHVVVNVAKLVNMQNDQQLKKSVEACDIINIDGMGVVIGARLHGHKIPERVAGVDLFHNLIAMSENEALPVYLLGATSEVIIETVRRLKLQHPKLKVAGYHHGYFWDNEEAVVNQVRTSGARLLFVAITSPRKENFINKWHDQLGVDFVMGVGGTFDVVAGKVNRAPLWMQKYGLEWFYRVLQEPRRMWKRYLVTNSIFAWYLLRSKLTSR